MERYIAAVFLSAVVTACATDYLSHETDGFSGGHVAEEMCIVDYSVSGGVQTKALGDGLDAGSRISSLIYLLYDSQGKLEKERVIPDIGPGTIWPLKRPDENGMGGNMTWAQREALKDTLYADRTYTAVFVANADPELFGLDGTADEMTVLHYKDYDGSSTPGRYYGPDEGQYSSGCSYMPLDGIYLSLPSEPFNDGNMFYLDMVEIGSAAAESQKATEAPVMLERIVSRTDIRRVNQETGYVGDGTDEAWTQYISDLVENSLYPSAEGEFGENILGTGKSGIMKGIRTFMEDFADEFSRKAAESGQMSGYAIFAGEMKSQTVSESVLDAVKSQIVDKYIDECAEMTDLRARMASWENESVTFHLNNVATKFMILDMIPDSDDSNGSEMSFTADSDGIVSAAGFGDGSGVFNSLSSVAVSSMVLDIPAGFNFWQGMNVMNSGEVNPLSSLTVSDIESTEGFRVSLDMDYILKNVVAGWDEIYEDVFNTIIGEEDTQGNGSYGGSLKEFFMTIQIPVCENNLVCTASAR